VSERGDDGGAARLIAAAADANERPAADAREGLAADAREGLAKGAVEAARLRWCLSGYYGAGNLGDEALLAGLVAGLRARGVTRVRVLSVAPAATAAALQVASHHRLRGLPWALLGSDVLVSGGGGLLQDATSTRSLGYYLSVIRAARALHRRVVVYGQSLGPLSAAGRRRVARALRRVPLGVRDAPSLRLATELGLPATLVADPALLLPVPAAAQRDALVLVPRGGVPWATEALLGLGRAALERGLTVEALACQAAQDGPEVARLAAGLAGLRRLPAEPPAVALAALAGARLVVSVRLHGLVLATIAAVPHVGLSYDPKVAGFAARSGAPCRRAPTTSSEADQALAWLRPALAAPSLDARARERLLDEARHGLDWLLHAALHGPSSASA
jgi:polysaccharide pyruvyl transferase CsaB